MEIWCRWLLHDSLKNCRLVVQFSESPQKYSIKYFVFSTILHIFVSLKFKYMFDENLFTPMIDGEKDKEIIGSQLFINFLNQLEGWKTKCKNLHWAAPKKNIHVYLDEFLDIMSDYQDGLAEGYMGILGKMSPNVIKGISSESLNAIDLISEVLRGTIAFYDKIPKETIYKGIASECETFIQNINKYKYLFSLCDIRPY